MTFDEIKYIVSEEDSQVLTNIKEWLVSTLKK